MVLPGSEIPEWFGDKGIGSSLTIQLPSNCHQLKGIAFCLVFLLPLLSHDMLYEFDFFRIYLKCHVESKNGAGAGAGAGAGDEVFFSKYRLYEHDKTRDLHLAQYAKESHLLIPHPGCSFIGDKLQNENEKALVKAANMCIQKKTRS
ncbi:disease resistance protein [Salix suchowensis]|nr:disease resistance protein [Salix suchowensis]